MKKNYVCIIPARGGSKGIPGKNSLFIAGKPLIGWSIDQAQNVPELKGSVYVTSDSDEILDIAKKHGANAIKRPEALSGDLETSETALLHALQTINNDAINGVVFLQPTSPLRSSMDITKAIEVFEFHHCDSLFSAVEMGDFFIWGRDKDGHFQSINYDYKNRKRRQEVPIQYTENGSLYIFKPEVLIQHNNRLGGKIGISLMEDWQVHEIDKPSDLEICQFYLERKNCE